MTKFLDKKMTFGPPKGGQWPPEWVAGYYVGLPEQDTESDEIERLIKLSEESMNERE